MSRLAEATHFGKVNTYFGLMDDVFKEGVFRSPEGQPIALDNDSGPDRYITGDRARFTVSQVVSEFKRRRIADAEEPVGLDPSNIRSSDTYVHASNEGYEIQKLTYDLHEMSHPRNLWNSCAGNVELSIEASQLSFGRKCLCKPPFRVPSAQLFGKGRRQGAMCAICSGHQLQVLSLIHI